MPGITYWREILAVLCLKILGLTLLYHVFLGPSHRPAVAEQAVARHLLSHAGNQAGSEENNDR